MAQLILWRFAYILSVLGALAAQAVFAATPDNTLELKRLDQQLAGIMATGQTPALAFGMVYQGNVVTTRALGLRVAGEASLKVDTQTRFRLASMSKTLSTALVGKLVEQGFVRWDTPVNLLVPSFRLRDPNSMFMTIEQLLSHRTGLPHHTLDDELEAASDFASVRALLPNMPGECAVGQCFAYQNMSFNVATEIVYAATGSSFEYMMQRELFEPLNMTRANIGQEALAEDDNWARPHERKFRRNVPVLVKPNYYWMPAAAGINASITDMQQWLLALLGHRPDALPASVPAQLAKPQVATPGEVYGPKWRVARLRSASYGLGLRVFDYAGNPVWYHAGAVAGFRGMIVVVPNLDAAFVLMWNSETNLPAGLVPSILDSWLGQPRSDWLELKRYEPQPVRRGIRRRR